jgi:uncharacterized protein (TIGR00297 family)
MLGFALLLRYLWWFQALLCALAACAFNLFLLPRFSHRVLRQSEKQAWRSGPFYYSLSVLILIAIFPYHLYFVAAAWAVMALGDGAASLAAKRSYGIRIPWNPDKSLLGSLLFVGFGTMGSVLVLYWTLPRFPLLELSPLAILTLSLVVNICCALIESAPWKLNDNLSVPLTAALLFYLLMNTSVLELSSSPEFWSQVGLGFLLNAFLAVAAWLLGWVRVSGCLAGIVVGTLIFGFQGWKGFVLLFTFFLFGSLATKLGYRHKQQLGIAQKKQGARGSKEVLANGGLAALLAMLAAITEADQLYRVGFASALAAATADTVSGEIGQWLGGEPILITNLRKVRHGTNGAISWIGTLAGMGATLLLSLIAFRSGLVTEVQFWVMQVAGFIGNFMDSFLGATFEGKPGVDNETVNFLNTLAGAGVGMALWLGMG